ncbi:MAG TPA: hypothetical protein VGK73_36380 [Polyangiaceae bacterium]
MKRGRALLGFGLVALGALAALARCTSSEQRPAETAPRTDTTAPPSEPARAAPTGQPELGGKAVAPSPSGADPASPSGGAPKASSPAPLAPAEPSSEAGSRISRALASSHPADLELLGRIERELHREPPPQVHALLRRRREGATRDELLGLARALPDLQLRVLAVRWVDEVRPPADAGTLTPAVRVPGTGTPLLKPITPVP